VIEYTKPTFKELSDTFDKFPVDLDSHLLKEMDKYVKSNLSDKKVGDIKAKEDFKV